MPVPAEAGIALAIGLAIAIVLCAFVASGGSQLERTTWTEVGLMLGGAGLTAAAIVLPRPAGTPAKAHGILSLIHI